MLLFTILCYNTLEKRLFMIKCVVSDLDGTLLNGAGEISERTKNAIHALTQKGISFVVATGRDIISASAVFEGMKQEDYIVLNGGMIYTQNKQFHECHLNEAELRKIDHLLNAYQISYIFFTDKGVVSNNADVTRQHFEDALLRSGMSQAEVDQMLQIDAFNAYADEVESLDELLSKGYLVYKCEFYVQDEAQYQELYQKVLQIENISIAGWVSLNMELTPQSANKGDALKLYLAHQNIALEECVVLGDSMNDASMMQVVPYSIAMQNASDALKEIAAYTLEYCNREDGAAYVMEQIIERNGE